MREIRHVLFIMTDQQRADYLGCAGHPTLRTPNLDALAAEGVLFPNAFCNATICGSSRMSFYTGRYMSTHGASWNNFPLSVAQKTLGDHLRAVGVRTALVGKTHMSADSEGMARVHLDPESETGRLIAECGFEPFERDDGLHPSEGNPRDLAYNRYLRSLGYEGDNPWHDYANAAEGPDGEILSGWYMRNAHLPARIREEHSETPYMTDRAIAFIEEAGEEPWCLHLSYIKPHWPYIAPAPYHAMYGADDVPPANRGNDERARPHPVHGAFMRHIDSETFSRDEVRARVIPTYMGLISQIDDHLGRLFGVLKDKGLWDRTLIVFTSDHGDYLGDHWLGEKEMFHEESVRIPMIVRDPRAAADATRGRVLDHLVEAIDLVPTFHAAFGGEDPGQWFEGRSLLPVLEGGVAAEGADWRDIAVSETDYAMRGARVDLGLAPMAARGIMLRSHRWKFVYWTGVDRPHQLFDLQADPREQVDLGDSREHADIIEAMRDRLIHWLATRRTRFTVSDRRIEATTDSSARRGFLIGYW